MHIVRAVELTLVRILLASGQSFQGSSDGYLSHQVLKLRARFVRNMLGGSIEELGNALASPSIRETDGTSRVLLTRMVSLPPPLSDTPSLNSSLTGLL